MLLFKSILRTYYMDDPLEQFISIVLKSGIFAYYFG